MGSITELSGLGKLVLTAAQNNISLILKVMCCITISATFHFSRGKRLGSENKTSRKIKDINLLLGILTSSYYIKDKVGEITWSMFSCSLSCSCR